MQQPNTMYYTTVPPNFPPGGPNLPSMFPPTPVSWGPVITSPTPHSITATPVSTAMYGTTSTFSWAQTVPTFMPWASKTDSAIVEPVVRFTAPFPPDPCTSQTATSWELLHNLGANKTNTNFHLKRRSENEDFDIPQKQCITEEKMSARMRELHISNQYSLPQQNSPFGPFGNSSGIKSQKPITSLEELNATLAEEDSGSSDFFSNKCSIVLAPEIKRLVEPEKLFAKAFVEEIERPNMAVVLWKPPEGVVKKIMDTRSDSKLKNEKASHTNMSSQNSHLFSQSSFQETNNNSISVNSGFMANGPHMAMPTSVMGLSPSPVLSSCVPDEVSASSFDTEMIMDV